MRRGSATGQFPPDLVLYETRAHEQNSPDGGVSERTDLRDDVRSVRAVDSSTNTSMLPSTPIVPSGPQTREGEREPIPVLIAATFTAEPMLKVLSYLLTTVGIDAHISFATHHAVTLQLLDRSSALANNRSGVNVLLLRLDSIVTPPPVAFAGAAGPHVMLTALTEAIAACARSTSASWIVVSCPPPPRVLQCPPSADVWRTAEARLIQSLCATPGVEVLRAAETLYPQCSGGYYDEEADRRAEIAYTPLFFAALGNLVARRIHACVTSPRKVMVLDCDNTLWSGVCGEDGPEGVRVDKPRRALQMFALERRHNGVLLCLCSRNNEADVWAVFEGRTDMILRRSDIVAWRMNWSPKSRNLRELAEELHLSLDTFVFIDDDPRECAEVRTHLPQVVTLQCGAGTDQQILKNLWVFDQSILTADDRLRSLRYAHNRERERSRMHAVTVEDFVKLLGLRVSTRRAAASDVPRIAQLTGRVTQFNCTLKRRRDVEVSELLNRAGCHVVVVDASDRYGDYGLVGVVIAHQREDTLDIDTFLLSCRALGRHIEQQMMRHLQMLARAHHHTAISLVFVPGLRNAMAKDFLDGFESARRRLIAGSVEYILPVIPES